MKKMCFVAFIACLAMAPSLSHAQDSSKAAQKADMRKALRQKWQNATPEEKAKMKAKAKEMKAKYDSLPPAQQQAIKEKLKARKDSLMKP